MNPNGRKKHLRMDDGFQTELVSCMSQIEKQ